MLIELKNICKSYFVWGQEVPVLKWINLGIEKGEFVSIMGHSGSWKSTLMNMLWMLDTPTSWEYFIEGKDVSNLTDDEQSDIRGKKIWFIFQTYNLIPRKSALEQVMLPLAYQWVWKSEREERAIQALIRVWLKEKIHNKPNELSGWQQQRIAIARALVINPAIILADEPTWALDTKTWDEVMELITELWQEWKTVIVITHEQEIADYAKRHILVKDWNIVNSLWEWIIEKIWQEIEHERKQIFMH